MDPPDEIADDLYGTPLADFIPRRDARAKELRKDKRREEADAVKALRKPSLSAWGLDQLARRDRELLDELLAAGAALRQARGGDTLRDATREERGAVARAAERTAELLLDAGHTVTDKTAGEIRDTLHAAALDEETRERLARGRLVEPRQAIGLGGFAAAATPAPAEEKPKKPKKPKAKPKPKKDDAAERRKREAEERKAEKERQKAARKALREAEAELRERERDLAAAERAAGKARAEVERRRSELESG